MRRPATIAAFAVGTSKREIHFGNLLPAAKVSRHLPQARRAKMTTTKHTTALKSTQRRNETSGASAVSSN
jgi:hypothetical protein